MNDKILDMDEDKDLGWDTMGQILYIREKLRTKTAISVSISSLRCQPCASHLYSYAGFLTTDNPRGPSKPIEVLGCQHCKNNVSQGFVHAGSWALKPEADTVREEVRSTLEKVQETARNNLFSPHSLSRPTENI